MRKHVIFLSQASPRVYVFGPLVESLHSQTAGWLDATNYSHCDIMPDSPPP